MASGLSKLSNDRLRPIRDEVYSIIRNAILKGDYEPGIKLIETEIADTLGVSRTPVREALRKLEVEKFVTYTPHKGAVVTEVEWDEIDELYGLRIIVECILVEKAVNNMTPEVIRKLKDNIRETENCKFESEVLDLMDQFNDIIYSISKSKHLLSILYNIRELLKRITYKNHLDPLRRKEAIEEHKRIIEALEKKDAALAVEYTKKHIGNSSKAKNKQH